MAQTDYNLKLKITADNQAEAELKKLSQQTEELSKSTENLQKQWFKRSQSTESALKKVWISAWAVFWTMTLIWKSAVEWASKREASLVQMNKMLENTWHSTQEEIDALNQLIKVQWRVWVVSKDVTLAAAKQFATFDMSAEAIQKIIPAFNDYIAWEKWMNATTDDAITLANWLAKALQGNFSSLTKAWWVIDEETASLIANGTEMERAEWLVKVLNSTYQDLNSTLAETTEFRLKKLNWMFWSIKAKIWEALLPVVERLLDLVDAYVVPAIEKVANWIWEHWELTAWVFTAITAVTWLVSSMSWLALILPKIWTAIMTLWWPVWWIIWAVALIATAWANNWWWIQEKTHETVEKIKEIIEPRLEKINERREKHWETVMFLVSVLRDAIQNTISAWLDLIWWLLEWFFQWLDILLKIFSWDWEWAWEWIKEQAVTIATTIDEVLTDLFWEAWQSIKDWVQWVYDWIVEKLTAIVGKVKEIVWQIKDAWNSTKNAVSNFWTNAINKVKWWFGWWKAVGWPVTAWTTYLVWEKWPELFVPSTSWKIVPNNQITNNDNGITINMWNVTIRRDSDIQELAQAIVRMTKLEKNYWII